MYMLICGERRFSQAGKSITVYNPATHEAIESVPDASTEDVDSAIKYAFEGFEKWSRTLLFERIGIIRKFADLIENNYETIAEIETREMGKPIMQSRSECRGAAETIREISEHARTLNGEVLPISNLPSAEEDMLITVREPYGVVTAIVPFNYPISQCILKLVPALLMGNTVIVKPASEAPLAVIKLMELLYEAGLPEYAAQVVTGPGHSVGKQLCEDERISVVSLTGSTLSGIQASMNAAGTLKHVLLELGGNDPLIILKDADMDYAVSEAVVGRYGCAGQICCGSKRFLVHEDIVDEFTEKLTDALSKLKLGDPFDTETKIGPLVSIEAAERAEKQIKESLEEGGRLLMGGRRLNESYIEPTVIRTERSMKILHDMEVFAPVWPIISFKTIDEAIEIANDTPYGLSSGCIGNDYRQLLKIAKEVKAGCVVLGGCGNYQTKDQGFGGIKMSGNAREGGHYCLEEFSRIKTIVFRKAFC